MTIENCSLSDLHTIYNLYDDARNLQTERKMVVWPYFEKQFLANEIVSGQQWKLVMNNEIACNWATTFTDKDIWGEKDKNDSVFIHRIVTNPHYRGHNFVKAIVEWAKVYAAENKKEYIRLDTLGNNTKLIAHYTNCGFNFLGIVKLENTMKLPLHYQKEPHCCLFEIKI